MANFPDTPVSLLVRLASEKTGVCDEAAWTRLFELYAPVIRAFAEERGIGGEGDDVVQEIFLKLVEVLGDGRLKIGGDGRQARGEGVTLSIDDPEADVEPTVDSATAMIIDAKWRLARRKAAVEWTLTRTALSAQSKNVYRAYALEGRPISEVAAAFEDFTVILVAPLRVILWRLVSRGGTAGDRRRNCAHKTAESAIIPPQVKPQEDW